MAIHDYDSPLLDWLSRNQGEFQFKFSSTPIAPWFPELKVVSIGAFYRGQELTGHSCGSSLTQSRLIALTECLERTVCVDLKVSSNGFAAHPLKERALEASWQELVERDAFLWHWHYDIAPQALPVPTFLPDGPPDEHLGVYQLQGLDRSVHVVLAVITTTNGGIVMGLAGKKNLEEAVLKAAHEAAIIRSYITTESALSENEFNQLSSHTPLAHARLGLDPDYARSFQQWLVGRQQKRPLLAIESTAELIAWPRDLETPPLFLARSRHADLIQLYFGDPPKNFPNPRPHPLG